MNKENKCWVCRRTEIELKKEKVIDFEDNKLEQFDSVAYKYMPYICNVCLELLSHFLAEQDLMYKDDITDEVKEALKEIIR